MVQVYLIRHTEVDVPKSTIYGQTDVPLRSNFEEDAKVVKNKLQNILNDAMIYSSPLTRCIELAKYLGNEFKVDNRLMELNFGDWEENNWDEIPKGELMSWMNDFVNKHTPNGESYQQLYERAVDFIQSFTIEKDLIIVTHGGIIRALKTYFMQTSLKESMNMKVEYGGIYKYNFNREA